MAAPVVSFPLIATLVRVIATVVLALLLTWALHFRGGLSLFPRDKDHIFNYTNLCLSLLRVHPVLLVIGLVLLNAMLVYKTVSGTKRFRKAVHLTVQSLAFCLSLIGLWAAYMFLNEIAVGNFSSLHSWVGLACLSLFGIQVAALELVSQALFSGLISLGLIPANFRDGTLYSRAILHTIWSVGFLTFWYPGGSISSTAALLPWHVFFGIFIYALAVAAAIAGILERATFLQVHHLISHYSTEALLLNSLGVLIVALGGCVILAVLTPINGKGDANRQVEQPMQQPAV